MRNLTLEKRYPFFVGFICGLLSFTIPSELRYRLANSLSNPMLNVMAILIGFLGAIIAILAASPEHKVIQRLKETGHYSILVSYASRAVYLAFITAALSGALMFFCYNPPEVTRIDWLWFQTNSSIVEYSKTCLYLVPIWVMFTIWSWMAALRFIRLIFRALEVDSVNL